MKTFKQFNEGLIDKMTPKSDAEIDRKFKELFDELVSYGMTEGYTQDEDIVKAFFEWKWEEITEYAEDGWTTDDIYSELQMALEEYCNPDEEDEEDDYYKSYNQSF